MDEPIRVLSVWVDMWKDHTVPASDVAYVLQRLLAETEDFSLFAFAPTEIQTELLSINEQFKQTGIQELGVPGGSGFVQTSEQASRCFRVLEAAMKNPTIPPSSEG